METIIHHLIWYNQYLLKIISQLICFIVKYIPLKQWAHDDSQLTEISEIQDRPASGYHQI